MTLILTDPTKRQNKLQLSTFNILQFSNAFTAASCLCVAVLVRPADWPAYAVLGQHLFIRIHRGVSKCKWHEISRLFKTKLAMMRTHKLVVDFQQENMGTR